jgi:hypothetical protein
MSDFLSWTCGVIFGLAVSYIYQYFRNWPQYREANKYWKEAKEFYEKSGEAYKKAMAFMKSIRKNSI